MTMRLELYDEKKHWKWISTYVLSDVTYTSSPQEVLKEVAFDSHRYAVLVFNEDDHLIGFFCLHLADGPEIYGFEGKDYALIRSFSIDERYRKKGYASAIFTNPFPFIQSHIDSKISKLILAVNMKNVPAQKTYIKAGFYILKQDVPGLKGPLLIMGKELHLGDS